MPACTHCHQPHDTDYRRCPTCRAYHRQRQRQFYATNAAYRARLLARQRRRQRHEARVGRVFRSGEAKTLLARLAAAGWTQRRIAAALGMHPSTVSDWKRGRVVPRRPSIEQLRQLARAVADGAYA